MANSPHSSLWRSKNGMSYRYLSVRINSVNDASISCKNFVNFCPVTPELTELICELLVRHGKKTGVFSWISPDILDRFSLSFYRMNALWVQMIDLDLVFRFVKGRCHGNQIILGEVINADWYYLHFCTSVRKRIGISHYLYVPINSSDEYKIGGLLTSIPLTSELWVHTNQLCTTGVDQRSG